MRKFIITENQAKAIMKHHILSEDVVSDVVKSAEFEKKVKNISKDSLKNDNDFKKEVEKIVKKIITDTLSSTFKTLWMRKEFWANQV